MFAHDPVEMPFSSHFPFCLENVFELEQEL